MKQKSSLKKAALYYFYRNFCLTSCVLNLVSIKET